MGQSPLEQLTGSQLVKKFKNFNLGKIRVKKRGKFGLNQSLIYRLRFIPLSPLPIFFFLPLFNPVARTILKILGGHLTLHSPPKLWVCMSVH